MAIFFDSPTSRGPLASAGSQLPEICPLAQWQCPGDGPCRAGQGEGCLGQGPGQAAAQPVSCMARPIPQSQGGTFLLGLLRPLGLGRCPLRHGEGSVPWVRAGRAACGCSVTPRDVQAGGHGAPHLHEPTGVHPPSTATAGAPPHAAQPRRPCSPRESEGAFLGQEGTRTLQGQARCVIPSRSHAGGWGGPAPS